MAISAEIAPVFAPEKGSISCNPVFILDFFKLLICSMYTNGGAIPIKVSSFLKEYLSTYV